MKKILLLGLLAGIIWYEGDTYKPIWYLKALPKIPVFNTSVDVDFT